MIYKKSLPTKNFKYKTITITDFSEEVKSELSGEVAKYKSAISLYNFITKNGKLQTGYGINYLTIPTSEEDSDGLLLPNYEGIGQRYEGAWLYKYYDIEQERNNYDLILYAENGYMYWISLFNNDSNIYRLYEIVLTSKPTVMNYRMQDRDFLLICNQTEGMIAWNGITIPTTITSAPNIRSVCVYKNRLWALTDDSHQIRYSKELNPTNWLISGNAEDSGIIRLSDQMGGTSKIISFMGHLYIIRDNGITKLTYFEEDDSYKLSHIFFAGSHIYGDSVIECEREIYFATRDGVFTFDGITTEKIELGINSLFGGCDQIGIKAVFHKDTYFLACKLEFNDNTFLGDETVTGGYVNNCLLMLNTKTKKIELLRGVDVVDMLPLEVGRISRLVVLTRGANGMKVGELTLDGKYYTQPLAKGCIYAGFGFGEIESSKLVKAFTIDTKQAVEVKIITDKVIRYFSVGGSNSPQKQKVNLPGKVIGFELMTFEQQAEINSFSLEVMIDG